MIHYSVVISGLFFAFDEMNQNSNLLNAILQN